MAEVYFMASYDVVDAERYESEYVPGVEATLRAAGADVMVASGSVERLEGLGPSQYVVFRFDSRDAFRAWYDGGDYESLRRIRDETTANGSAVLAAGFQR